MHKASHRIQILHGGKILSGLIGLFLMFSGITVFAQSCQLLPGRNPNTLANGQSRTGYMSSNATYTQTCNQMLGVITCNNGTLINGNTYRYQSCTPHTRANCSTPTTGNHLEFKPLYKLAHATAFPQQTCSSLAQSFQCINGTFTGIGVSLYPFGSCIDQSRLPCINTRTNTYVNNAQSILGYMNNQPTPGQTCTTLQRTLTCVNGARSGGSQLSLYPTCTSSGALNACFNIWTQTGVLNGMSIVGYTALHPTLFGQTCINLQKPLTCINGIWSGGNQSSLYSGCTNAPMPGSCQDPWTLTGTIPNGGFTVGYSQHRAQESNNEYCTNFYRTRQCINGTWSGGLGGLVYSGCINVGLGSCRNPINSTYTNNHQSIYAYVTDSATSTSGCSDQLKMLTCNNGGRTGGTITNMSMSCNNCHLPRNEILLDGTSTGAYSATGAEYPQSCNDIQTELSCSNGILNGNRQTYMHPTCVGSGQLTPGVDIAILSTFSGLPGGGTGVAQKSSPVITLALRNGGKELLSGTAAAGFITCLWTGGGQGITLYSSPTVSPLIINSGTKIGINVKLNNVFTQSLGNKIITCQINPGTISPNIVGTDIFTNNTWTQTFEIIDASRFDLAMGRSIESIRQNLDAAEGAGGAIMDGTQAIQNFVFNKVMAILVPLIVAIGILIAMIGFYKIMFSSDEKATTEGTNYIIYGVIGIILIMSAKFIGSHIYTILTPTEIKGYEVARQLYNDIAFPFIKFAMYLVLGAMFIILISRVITFVFGTDTDAKKKAGTLIGRNVLGMLVIIGAKQIVEAVFGKQNDVVRDISNLGEIGSGILADKNIPLIYQIINRVLGLTALAILIVVIIQTIMLLTQPSDEKQMTNMKKSILYMVIGLFVIGIGYLIVNFLIIN